MVEGQVRHIVHAEPGCVPGVGRRVDVVVAQLHQRVVGDGDHALPGIALDRAEGVELLEEDLPQAGLFLELTPRRLFQGLVDAHEAARAAPTSLRRAPGRAGSASLSAPLIETEDDTVHGQGTTRIFVGMRHAETLASVVAATRSKYGALRFAR